MFKAAYAFLILSKLEFKLLLELELLLEFKSEFKLP